MQNFENLSRHLHLSENNIFKQLGYNDHYDNLYNEIVRHYLFTVEIHVQSLSLSEFENIDLNESAYILPFGILSEMAETIDNKMPEASILLRSSILYECVKVIYQRSIIMITLRKNKN